MGNHEYCELCGENTLHLNRPCDPTKVIERQNRNKTKRVFCSHCKFYSTDDRDIHCLKEAYKTYPEFDTFEFKAHSKKLRLFLKPAVQNKDNNCEYFESN